jgi:hypothetical protein
MTPAVTLWLAFVTAAGAIAWFGSKRQAIAFVVVAIATAPLSLVPLGHATPLAPPAGEHTVLGARVDVDKAIYVLLDGPTPVYYVLPYSEEAAKALQEAQRSAAEGEGQVAMRMGQDGTPGFFEKAPAPEPAKSAERAVIGG